MDEDMLSDIKLGKYLAIIKTSPAGATWHLHWPDKGPDKVKGILANKTQKPDGREYRGQWHFRYHLGNRSLCRLSYELATPVTIHYG